MSVGPAPEAPLDTCEFLRQSLREAKGAAKKAWADLDPEAYAREVIRANLLQRQLMAATIDRDLHR